MGFVVREVVVAEEVQKVEAIGVGFLELGDKRGVRLSWLGVG